MCIRDRCVCVCVCVFFGCVSIPFRFEFSHDCFLFLPETGIPRKCSKCSGPGTSSFQRHQHRTSEHSGQPTDDDPKNHLSQRVPAEREGNWPPRQSIRLHLRTTMVSKVSLFVAVCPCCFLFAQVTAPDMFCQTSVTSTEAHGNRSDSRGSQSKYTTWLACS